jgi:SAM-dependent methyltransferase
MKTWHKAVLRNTLKAMIPGKQVIRQVMRRVRPYQTNPTVDINLFNNAMRQVDSLRAAGLDIAGRRVLEIGSGWHPIVPVTFIAAGARSVALTDIERLLDARLVRSAIDYVLARREELERRIGASGFDRLAIPDGPLPAMLDALGMSYTVPWRTAMTPSASVDLIVSCSVLEHIEPRLLEAMLADCRRILAPGGAMVHFIDCSDHRAMRDKTLSRVDFLRYEDRAWRLLSLNPQSYHNRLRFSEHRALIERQGFRIPYEWRESRELEQAAVAAMPLASRFRGYHVGDLAAISAHFVAVTP